MVFQVELELLYINTREIATEYRLTQWAGIMRERQESGLSIKAFCEQSGFHENVYFYWQRKLREAACQALLPTVKEEPSTSVVPQGWAMVSEPPKSEPVNKDVYIEIGKSRITVSPDVDPDQLTKVCRVLIELC